MRAVDMTGQVCGRLTVLRRVVSKDSRAMWECVCTCGKHIVTSGYSLRSGNTKSCSCLQKDKARTRLKTHGMSDTSLYYTWDNMCRRCEDASSQDYRYYGGRGISVCSEWHDPAVFIAWALESGYREGLTIDRVDNDGDYCPSNCRWTDRKSQARNTRRNVLLTYNGYTHCIMEWSDITGIPESTIRFRIHKYGWDVAKALTTLPGRGRPKKCQ